MLDSTVSITVPSTQGVKGKIKRSEHQARVNEVLAIMGQMFGGATATSGLGSYVADDGTLVIETVVIVESYTTSEDLEANKGEVEQAAKWYAGEWGQESIAWASNGVLQLATKLV